MTAPVPPSRPVADAPAPTYEQLQCAVIQLVRMAGRCTERGFEVRLDDDPRKDGWPEATLETENLGTSRFAAGNVILWRVRRAGHAEDAGRGHHRKGTGHE